jgi:hypothetical protein
MPKLKLRNNLQLMAPKFSHAISNAILAAGILHLLRSK